MTVSECFDGMPVLLEDFMSSIGPDIKDLLSTYGAMLEAMVVVIVLAIIVQALVRLVAEHNTEYEEPWDFPESHRCKDGHTKKSWKNRDPWDD